MDMIDNNLVALLLLAVFVLLAGVVRGAVGFGFSALVIAAGTLLYSPILLVPMVVLLEIAASVQMLPKALPQVHWRVHNTLLVSLALATPIGVYALAVAPEPMLRLVVAFILLLMASMMLAGWRFKGEPKGPELLGLGFLAGLCNGIAAVGGMPIAIYLNSSSLGLARARATMVLLFFGTELFFIISALVNGIYTSSVLSMTAAMLLPMMAGVWLGEHVFQRVDEQRLRRAVMQGLFVLALLGLWRAWLAF